jgi:hypothetical protein
MKVANIMLHFAKYNRLLATKKELQKHGFEITVIKYRERSHLSSYNRCYIIYLQFNAKHQTERHDDHKGVRPMTFALIFFQKK